MGTFLPILQILVCMHVLWWVVQGMDTESSDDTLIDFLSGEGSYEGVVYYQAEGRRALICDQTWTDNEADVACRMQGYGGGTATKVVSLASKDYTDIFQWDIVCNGNEDRLGDCPVYNKEDNPTSCHPNNIAQVRCRPIKDWDFRMTGSEYLEQGRVETYKDGKWVKVWLNPEDVHANIRIYDLFCTAMGYDQWSLHHYDGEEQMPFEGGPQDAGALCEQQTDHSIVCSDHTEGTGNGVYSQTGIVCKPLDIVAYHPIRLFDINTDVINNQSGLVQIYNKGQWGNICDNSENPRAWRICTELGYPEDNEGTSLDTQPVDDGTLAWFSTIYKELITCDSVFACEHTAWGDPQSDCNPKAVRCAPAGATSTPAGGDPGGRATSLDGLALSLIIMVVVVTVDLGFVGV